MDPLEQLIYNTLIGLGCVAVISFVLTWLGIGLVFLQVWFDQLEEWWNR